MCNSRAEIASRQHVAQIVRHSNNFYDVIIIEESRVEKRFLGTGRPVACESSCLSRRGLVKRSNLSFGYLFINHDRACWDQLRSERREQTRRSSFSLADFDSIIAPDVTAAFNERLPESSSLPTSSLPARVIATRGRRSEWWCRWRGRARESEKDREEGER